jgi:hypothetical protein
MAQSLTSHRVRPMNIHVIGNSAAGRKYINRGGIPDLEPEALAPGLPSTPAHNLKFHGGKTIQSLTFTNFFVGSNTSWAASDISSIDHALAGAMSEPTLNNVMVQYFAAMPTSTFRPSMVLPGAAPATMSQGDVEQLVTDLNTSGRFNGFDLTSTVFNFMLPRGTVLNDNPAKGARQGMQLGEEHHRRGVPDEDEANSLNGLGGYHGSVIIGTSTIYYAVGVFS